jgi:hypothetical protein
MVRSSKRSSEINHCLPVRTAVATLVVALAVTTVACDREEPVPPSRSAEEVVWIVEYMAYACGPFSPQLRPVGGMDQSLDLEGLETGLMMYVANDLIPPDQIDELRVPGNRFQIRGYYYSSENGHGASVAPRFDLCGWRPVPPFSVWTNGEPKQLSSLEGFDEWDQLTSRDCGPAERFTIAAKYADCL